MDKIWFYIFCIQIFAARLAYLFLTRNHYLHLYKVFQKLCEGNSIKLKIFFFWKATVRVNDILDAHKLERFYLTIASVKNNFKGLGKFCLQVTIVVLIFEFSSVKTNEKLTCKNFQCWIF